MVKSNLVLSSGAHTRHEALAAGVLDDPSFLRTLLAVSGDSIKILDLTGRLVFASERGRQQAAPQDMSGLAACDWAGGWEGDDAQQARDAVRAALEGRISRFTGAARTMDGVPRWWDVQVAPILDASHQPERLLVISRDVTERQSAERRQAALIELGDTLRDLSDPAAITTAAARILGRALQAGRAAYAQSADAGALVIGPNWTGAGLTNAQGVVRAENFGDSFERLARGEVLASHDMADPSGMAAAVGAGQAAQIRALMAVPLVMGARLRGVLLVHDTVPRAWTATEKDFARGVADRCTAALAEAEAEARQVFLNAELSHRMKNILAMAQAIALQTMRAAPDVASATEVLSGRLSALGKAHDILLGGGHSGGNVRSVVEGALRMHDDRRADRFVLRGEHLAVGHRAGLPLALIVHELATNAAKFGALSSETGAVDVAWTVVDEQGEPTLALTWTEHGGPPVQAPARRGFGSRLIERGLAGQLGGAAVLDYAASGLVCSISIGVAALQAQD
jgi:PAS domain S-box-containing protein